MKLRLNQSGDRREFVRNSVRFALLATATGAIAHLAAARRVALSGPECINRSICGGCAVFEKCELPKALAVKRVRQGGNS